jgi:hypothetical protein
MLGKQPEQEKLYAELSPFRCETCTKTNCFWYGKMQFEHKQLSPMFITSATGCRLHQDYVSQYTEPLKDLRVLCEQRAEVFGNEPTTVREEMERFIEVIDVVINHPQILRRRDEF